MGSEKSADINLTELLLKISSDVSAIKTDMQNFKDTYKSEKLLTTYTEALRTQKDKEDAKKWRTTIAFILTGVGGLLIGSIPFILKAFIQAGAK